MEFEIAFTDLLKPYDVKPMDGYSPHGNNFPFCCEFHTVVFTATSDWAKEFLSEDEAIKLAQKTVNQLSYTEYYITTLIDIDEWYEYIASDIEYNVCSFGASITNAHKYLMSLLGILKHNQLNLPIEKTERLSFLVFSWVKNSILGRDIHILRKTFELWFHTFPFDLSLFKDLKDRYSLFFSMINDDWRDHSEETFTEDLNILTNSLLTQINSYKLLKQGLLYEPGKLKLELIVYERKLQLEKGYLGYKKGGSRAKYKRMIKRWFKDEKKFINEFISIVNSESSTSLSPVLALASPEPPVSTPEIQIMYDGSVERIWQQLLPFNLAEVIGSKRLTANRIKEMLSSHSGTQLVPYSIALLHDIGFLDYFIDTYCKNKEDGLKKLAKILESNYRSVKGNVNVLVPGSTEDSSRYTSVKYLKTIRKELLGV